MLAHFPILYEDELLYSGIARYHLQSGNRTQRQTVEDLFGDRLVCATVDFPSHLGRLAGRLQDQYSVDQLIQNHTLFPYYSYYLNAEKCAQIKLLMAQEATTGVAHASLGLLAGLIKSPTHLKYCILCYREESARLEPYWHRSHQLPGVVICQKHKVPLQQSTVMFSTRDHKFTFIPVSQLDESNNQCFKIDRAWERHLQFIAEKSAGILNSTSNYSTPNYTNALYQRGYQTAQNRTRVNKLITDFREFYTDQLLHFLQCDIDPDANDTWLHKLVRGHRDITQPLRHLLLCSFLDDSMEKMRSSEQLMPFGKGLWPCLNKAAEHFKSNEIAQCIITRCSKTGLPVGTFICSCGFIYSRRGPDRTQDDRFIIGRIKAFGEVWVSRLKELNRTIKSLRAKAGLLGVDPTTVKKQTELLEVAPHKKSWISHRNDTVRTARKDRPRKKSGATRIDWRQRDELLYKEVKTAVQHIRTLNEPLRITVNSIARAIPAKGLSIKIVKKSLDKLPMTKELILASIETTEMFQIRRLVWAAEKLEATGTVASWRILKLAGLNPPLRKPVQEKFIELLEIRSIENDPLLPLTLNDRVNLTDKIWKCTVN